MPTQEQIDREKRFDELFGKDQYGGKLPFRQDKVLPFLNSEVEQAVLKEKLRLLEILSKWALKTKTTEALDMIEEAQKEIAH